MAKFEIWEEGFHAQGVPQVGASLVAVVEANSFKEACTKHFEGNNLFDSDRMTHWGCRLFDNEADARKSFG